MKYSNAVLEIPSFQQDDTGGYECVAENKMGKNIATGRLAFHGTVTLWDRKYNFNHQASQLKTPLFTMTAW